MFWCLIRIHPIILFSVLNVYFTSVKTIIIEAGQKQFSNSFHLITVGKPSQVALI